MATETKETKTSKKAKETPVRDPFAANRIEIPAVNMDLFKCTLVGTTPLIIHALGPKKRKELLASMQKNKKKSTAVKEDKDPVTEYFDAMYVLDGDARKDQENTFEGIFTPVHYSDVTAIHGVRAAGFRKAMVRAAKSCGAKMTDTRCNMSVYSAFGSFVPIKFETLVSGEDPVKLVGNKTDLRYRPYYNNWSVDFQLEHMSDIIAPEQIIQLLRIAGRVVGVGEWRNERDGENGAFDVDLASVCVEKQSL
jgi:hypothetical protein